MGKEIALADISIRNNLCPGDIGYITYLHGCLYQKEYCYGIDFETYVARGLDEFYQNYNAAKDRIWLCEHDHKIIGTLLLMHRQEAAQLRFFMITPPYRGIGLGQKLMNLYMEFFKKCGYNSSYLWTTHELHAAASLYTRHGFRLAEEKKSTAFGKPVTEQRYALTNSRNG